jgi:hypothetical protein
MATYVNDLRLKEIGTGESSGTWGTETNVNLELIGEALGFGTEAITTNADTHTTTVADGSTDPGRAMYIKYTGTLDSACTITIGPNTMSRLHYIENGTSGSQNIIISQGSGANITIPAGDTKAVYLDGAGSGAAVVDVFASFSAVDLKVQDDLTVTDDATIGGTLGVTGILTCTDDIIIGDGKTIGSASDVDAITIASNGQVTFTQTLIGTALDISGDIDVDGTSNLDVVDIDGAVDMASTLTVAGVVDITDTTDSSDATGDTGALRTEGGASIAKKLYVGTDLDVDGTANLDVVDIDGAVDMASTLAVGGVVTANAGVVVDNITIDGTQIDLSSGDLLIDSAGKIQLSADTAGDIELFDGTLHYATLSEDNSNFLIQSIIQDEDILFKGDDGGSVITALTLDMSLAGTAIFNHDIEMPDAGLLRMGAGGDLILTSDGTNGTIFANNGNLTLDVAGELIIDVDTQGAGNGVILKDDGTAFGSFFRSSSNFHIKAEASDQDMIFMGNDGGSEITALSLDMSAAGAATFGDPSYGSGLGQVRIVNNANSIAPASLSLFGFGNVADDAEYAKIDAAMQLSGTAGQVAASISFQADGTGENKSHIDFLTHDSSSLATVMRLRSDGNVGIGTNSPFGTTTDRTVLSVNGTSSATLNIGTGGTQRGYFFSDGSYTQISSVGSIPLRFGVADSEKMRIDTSGNVLVGTTSSDHKFMVNQETVNKIGGMFYNNTSTNAACLKVLQDGAGSSGPALLVRQDGSGNAITVDDGSDGNTVFSVSQNGGVSKASGSFKIKHPLEAKKDTHYLVHSFVEAPQADNIYRGTATLSSGTATVNLDTVSGMTEGTYVLLNTNTSCFTSNETDWDAVKGSVTGNILTINCQNSSSTATVSWLVIGERHDQHMKDTDWTDDNGKVIVEPLKGE